MIRRSKIIGWGSYLPQHAVSNEELAKRVDTSDEWITQRTGIKSRHLAAEGELTSHLAINAAKDALARASLEGADIDAIILATTTPDRSFPATAMRVQVAIGMQDGFAMDVQAVCTGFIYALSVADNFIKSGQANRVLVIGADTFSRLVDWEDRATCVLFGDGAGAVILESAECEAGNEARGVISTHLHSDGTCEDLLYADGGVSSTGTAGKARMLGKEVFRHAVTRLAEAADEALSLNDIAPDQLDWLVPHQANRRIIESTAKKLNMSMEKVILTVDKHGNTSAASVPLALAVGASDGRIKEGDLLLLEGMGGGFTWGSALVRW